MRAVPEQHRLGAAGGPEFATTVVVAGAGHEQGNVTWADARGRWDMASRLAHQQQPDELIAGGTNPVILERNADLIVQGRTPAVLGSAATSDANAAPRANSSPRLTSSQLRFN